MKLLFGMFALLALASTAFAAPMKIEPTKTWKGSVAEEGLAQTAPTAVINQKALDALWLLWKQPGKAPQVDFAKEFVVLATSSGSLVNLSLQKDGNDLKVIGFGTRDLRPGFRFVMGSVPREGIATINGAAMPKDN